MRKPSRSWTLTMLAGFAASLAGCATPPAPPPVIASPIVLHPLQLRPMRVARVRRIEPQCTRADLPAERKEALFRQFDASIGSTASALPPPNAVDCRQASR